MLFMHSVYFIDKINTMKNLRKDKILFSSGLLCTSASVIIWNFSVYDALQGFMLGLGFVLTVYGYASLKKNRSASGL